MKNNYIFSGFLTSVLILFFFASYSQNFRGGIVAGLNGGQIDGDTQRGFNKVGGLAGLFVDYPLSEKFSIGAEMYYIGKGAVKQIENADGSKFEEFKTVLNYVEVPFLLRYQVLKKISISGGIAPAYLFSSKMYGQAQELAENTYQLRNYDIEPILEADFRFFKKLGLTLRYSFSVITIRTDNVNWFNKDLSIGLRYNIK